MHGRERRNAVYSMFLFSVNRHMLHNGRLKSTIKLCLLDIFCISAPSHLLATNWFSICSVSARLPMEKHTLHRKSNFVCICTGGMDFFGINNVSNCLQILSLHWLSSKYAHLSRGDVLDCFLNMMDGRWFLFSESCYSHLHIQDFHLFFEKTVPLFG